MKVLIGMECSGRVREAFRALGHDAWSCDILPAEDGSRYHIQGSVFDHETVNAGWDLGIFHPDCTFVAGSGARWMSIPWRRELQAKTAAEFRSLWAMPIKAVVIENPDGRIPKLWQRWTQRVHPWWFGQRKLKPTCLWIRGVKPLLKTNEIRPPRVKDMTSEERREWCEVHLASPGKDRGQNRARTFQALADAYAMQFGGCGHCDKEPGDECYTINCPFDRRARDRAGAREQFRELEASR